MRYAASIALLLVPLLGCTQTRTFLVAVKNATPRPITIGFVKSGPDFDPDWASPEAWTEIPPSRRPIEWGREIAPDGIVRARISGKLDAHSVAFLRVYGGGGLTVADLLAKSHGTGDRLDLVLDPGGPNAFLVTEDDRTGHIAAHLAHFAMPDRPNP